MKHTWSNRLISLLLALVITLQLIPTTVWATESDLATAVPEESQETSRMVVGEIEELRTESEKHYRLSDGSYIVVDYGMPVHYAQADGAQTNWVDIDNTLWVATAQAGMENTPLYTAVNGAEVKSFAAVFTPDSYLFSAQMGAYGVSVSLLQEATASQLIAAASQESAMSPEESGPAAQDGASHEAVPEETVSGAEIAPDGENLENTAPQETTASTEAQLLSEEVETSLPEEDESNSVEVTAPTEASQATEATSPDTAAPTEETFPAESQDAPPAEDATQPQNLEPAGELVDLLQPSQAQVINPDGEMMPLGLGVTEALPISEQVELPRLSSTILYPDILPGVDLQYDTAGRNMKESIIVNEIQADYTYRFLLSLEGLTPSDQEDGSILLCNSAGEALYQIPAPYMVDASGAVSCDVTYTLTEIPEGFILTVTADTQWVNASNRTLPVTIDPALIVVTGKKQADIITNYIDESKPTTLKYGSHMYMGNNAGYTYRGLLYFASLPSIPQNCSVAGATLKLYKMSYESIGVDQFYGEIRSLGSGVPDYEAEDDPAEMYANWLTTRTWNNTPDVGDVVDYQELYATGSTGKYIEWDISRPVTQWYSSGKAQDRFLAMTPYFTSAPTSGSYANVAFYTFTNNVSHIPMFIVFYRNDVGLEGRFTYQTVSAGRAGTGYVGDYTSQMTWANTVVSDASNTLPFALTLYHNSANRTTDFVNSETAGIHTTDYTTMRIGVGWKLSVQESITQLDVETDAATIRYYVYHDSDGTEHYFQQSGSSPYKDDEGLGLSLTVEGAKYTLEDKGQNKKIFYNGYLVSLIDANGNALHYVYNNGTYSATSDAWKPKSGQANRVTSVVRVNDVGSKTPKTVCTLTYDGNYLRTVKDAANRVTTLNYSSTAASGRRLTSLAYPDGKAAQYFYTSGNAIYRAYDGEAQYGLEFMYQNFLGKYSVYKVTEYTASTISGTQTTGNAWRCWVFSPSQKEYRFFGEDQKPDTADDIVVRYTFDSAGRTVNAINLTYDKAQVLGVSANTYTKNDGVSAKNNRLTGAASMGSAAVNLLNNSGFEGWDTLSSDTSRYAWKQTGSGSVYIAPGNGVYETPRTGANSLRLSLSSSQVSNTSDSKYAAVYQEVYLTKNTAYTFSGYFDTSGMETTGKNGGAYLCFANSAGTELEKSRVINYKTNDALAGGWTRVDVTYTPSSTGWYRVSAVLRNASLEAYADDLQLEAHPTLAAEHTGASSVNLLQLGSFELWNGSTADREQDLKFWDYDPAKAVPYGTDAYGGRGYSMYIPGKITEKRRASQTVPLNCSAETTFILSGWGQAASAPGCASASEMSGDNSGSKRFFGLIAKLTYSDNTTEYHYVAFDELYTGWQYASGFIAPKQTGKTISAITVTTAYDYNVNTARFDNLSLVQEPVQTYTYDNEGNLQSVTDAASGEETYTYDGADLKQYVSSGSGTYEYEYDSSHNMTKATNDGVSITASYDGAGNALNTTLRKGTSGAYLQSKAEYTVNGDYTSKVTDVNGVVTGASYTATGLLGATRVETDHTTGASIVTNRTYIANTDRLSNTYITNWASVKNDYNARGYLSEVTRKAFPTDGSSQSPIWQRYAMTYDAWGNTTAIKVQGSSSTTDTIPTSWYSGVTLASYAYDGQNGNLSRMTYGNGAYLLYDYDLFGRTTKVEHRNAAGGLAETELYFYDGNGNVGRMLHLGADGEALENYIYEYDSLGRLIRSQMEDETETVLQTEHLYDAQNRLSGQNYYIGGVDFTESYTYNNNDGSLTSMNTASGGKITYTYDAIKRLATATAKTGNSTIYTKGYTYAPYGTSGTQSTAQVSRVSYTLPTWSTNFQYSYDARGNITGYGEKNDTLIEYSYDTLGQLTGANDKGENIGYTYSYDTAGNMQRASRYDQTTGANQVDTYQYGNYNWRDLLTAYNNQKIAYEGQTYNSSANTVTGTVKSGNPISYYNGTRWNFTWEDGRELASATTSTDTTDVSVTYAYDLNGLRTEKTVVTTTHPIQHTVTFKIDSTVVKTMTVEDGYYLKDGDYPEVPSRYGYVGSWNKYTGRVTKDITITVNYVFTIHTVRFIDDGTVMKTMEVLHGYTLQETDYPTPLGGPDIEWDYYTEPVYSDIDIHAIYPKYTVSFIADGVTVKTMTVEDGYTLTDADYPAVPEKTGYHGSWNQYASPIYRDMTIQASYHEIYTCTVRFVVGSVTLKTMTVEDEYVLKNEDYPTIPQKTGYQGVWNKYTSPITEDITVQGRYEPEITLPPEPTPPYEIMSPGEEEPGTAADPQSSSSATSTVTEHHSYVYASGRLLRETITTTVDNGAPTTVILDFAYDAQGTPYSMTYTNGTAAAQTYYYITNLQGDVMYLVSASGTKVATYSYDPYGKVTSAIGTMAEMNPLRYRSYCYDADTEFYYLQSRYYDANICRFINADSYSSTGQGFIGQNMFAYCLNSPITGYDPSGEWNWGGVLIGLGIIAGAALTVATFGIGSPLGTVIAGAAVTTGAAITYAAATDSAMVVDMSVTTPSNGGVYGKFGTSVIVDFYNDEINLYNHTGFGYGKGGGISYSVGLIANYEFPEDYEKHFLDVNGGNGIGIDHCWNPLDDYSTATKATSITFSVGKGCGVGYDYYYKRIKLMEW